MAVRRAACLCVLLLAALPGGAVAQSSDNPYYDFLVARHLEAEGDSAAALAALQRAAAADPKSAEVQAEIASFHFRRNERDDAQKAANAALALDPDNAEANRVLGLLDTALAENEKNTADQTAKYVRDAIAHLEKAVAGTQGVTDPTLNYALGRLYLVTGQTDKAVQALGRLVDQNPGSVQGRLALAQAQASRDDLKGAIATLEEIVDDEPRVAGALAQYQQQAGMLKEAIDTYTRALAVQPNSRELKVRRIIAIYDEKDYSRAAQFAAEAQKQHPDDPRFPRLEASAYNAAGDRTKAIEVLEASTKAFPKDTISQLALADIYSKVNRKADAERMVRQVLTVEPNNADAMNYLGYMLANQGAKLDEAIRLVSRALEIDPGNGAFLDSLGWAYYRKGNVAEAERYLTTAAEKLPHNSDVQDHFGDVLAKRGRWSDAVAAWTRALDGDGQDINRADVQKKIEDARRRVR